MRSSLLRWPPAFARVIQAPSVGSWGVVIAKDRLRPYSRLPEQILCPHLDFATYSIFCSRFSTYRKPAIPEKDEKATVSSAPLENIAAKKITRKIFFTDSKGERHTCEATDGESVLDIAKSYDLEVEGACQGDCACSTCHVIVTSTLHYGAMDSPTDREEDMLDLAFGLTFTSRLGCQIHMAAALDGIELKLPGIMQEKSVSL